MNKKWHAANPMPPNATRDDRIRWHVAHAQACQCRRVPASLRKECSAIWRPVMTRTAKLE